LAAGLFGFGVVFVSVTGPEGMLPQSNLAKTQKFLAADGRPDVAQKPRWPAKNKFFYFFGFIYLD
jgi:hypothetical protein